MDLVDFLSGSEGRLGVAASLKIRLAPAPGQVWSVVCFFRSGPQALRFAQSLAAEGGEGMRACWLMDSGLLSLLDRGRGVLPSLKSLPAFPEGAQAAVYEELSGTAEDDLESLLFSHLDLFQELGGREEDTWAAEGAQAERIKGLRHCAEEAANAMSGGLPRVSAENSLPVSRLEESFAGWREELDKTGMAGVLSASFLDGRMQARLLPESARRQEEALDIVYRRSASDIQMGGLFAASHGIGKARREMAQALMSGPEKICLRKIQNAFDPLGVMSSKLFL
jgi:FAD/FMN-containing dehydrogenase